MTRVRILLRGGHVYETSCAPGAALLDDLAKIVASAGNAGVANLEMEQNGTKRGLAIPYSQIVAVETEPPVVFQENQKTATIYPSPYIRIPGFLSDDENKAVLDYAVHREQEFQASSVEGGASRYRHSQVIFKLDDLPVELEQRVRELLPEVCAYFKLELPANYDFEMQMTTHGDGGYFKIHNDNSTPRTATRFLTYIYYFHRQPAAFSGGGLRLYDDSRADPNNWVPVATFTEIKPENNTLVFFPSRHFHEVLPTLSRTGNFGDGRFTINGWIRRPART